MAFGVAGPGVAEEHLDLLEPASGAAAEIGTRPPKVVGR
jgi:hypothetical protein